MALPALSSPPLLAFVSGVAWAVIAALSYNLGQSEPLQQYYIGALVGIVGGALPTYLIDRAGLSMGISLIGFFSVFAVWMVFDQYLSPRGDRRSIV